MTKTESTILDKIVLQRRVRIAELYDQFTIAELKPQLQPSTRSLAEALSTPASSFILECKKASPSKGLIRPNFNPVTLAQSYAPYAAAISVLTEPDFFNGSFEYLTAVTRAVKLPVLCKDFIVDPLQVYLARYYGADAILLMLSVLDDTSYRELAKIAEQLQLDVLTEVSDAEEMQRASQLGATIIGINNRNLRDLSIDPQRSIELSKQAPANALIIAESGFSDNPAIRATAPSVDGFLIGSALSAATNVDQACRELLYGAHKVCGLTRPEDALVAQTQGAGFGGLIFVPHSKRCIQLEQARSIMTFAPQLNYVGVFANQSVNDVAYLVQQLGLYAVQLHGNETTDYITELREKLATVAGGKCQIWLAISVSESVNLADRVTDLSVNHKIDRVVLDNGAGGTGTPFNWQLLDSLSADLKSKCLLAGGLSSTNVSAAQATGLTNFDFNSGVEQAPGIKDAGQLRQVFQQLRQYGREQAL